MTGSGAPDSVGLDIALLAPAVEAARRALRHMKDKDIPPGLRNVAARSGRLPPPLARKLLQSLDESEWLRAEALAEWVDIDAESPDRKWRASAAFLQRPKGWEDQVRSAAEETADDAATRSTERLAVSLEKAQRRIERLEMLLAEAQERGRAAETLVAERLRDQAERLNRGKARELAEKQQLQRAVADLEERMNELIADRDALRLDLATRLPRAAPPPTPTSRRPSVWELGSAQDLARYLDDLVAAGAVAPRGVAPVDIPASSGSFRLPQGLAPDRAESIYWLLEQPVALMVAIDGWNAAHLLMSPPDLGARRRIVEAGRRLAAASVGKRRVIVMFDSREGSDHLTYPEVEVRFVASADEGILELARITEAPLVVVSSDRRVREGAEAAGAVGLWSQALVDWLETGGRRTFRA